MSTLPYLRTGSGPVLVLVHGYLGGAAQWQCEIDLLSKDYDVIAPNLPGFGAASDQPGCATIADMADAIFDLLDRLGVTEFDLLGHSMGGMIVQQMAAQRTAAIRKLILYGTGPLGLMPDRFEPIAVSSQRLCTDGVTQTIARIGATWFKAGQRAAGYPLLVEIGSLASEQAATAALDAMAGWDGRANLHDLSMPILVIWGDSDQSYRWPQIEELWTRIPNVQLSVVPGTAHAVHLEKPEIFGVLIKEFLAA